jgi:hypothetical protein
MPRLAWDTAGDRFYESGVDRGVLYLPSQPGVPWSGLISVSENPSGGEPRPFYMDGLKYLNLASAEEFEATLDAYSAPPEFGPCDGNVSIQNGLIATQQPRLSFGLSYRSRIGTDTTGPEHGYKIHLVYGALAGVSQRSNKTFSGSPTPTQYSWAITTMPPNVSGFKPTGHFIVDSRYADPLILSNVEDALYGTDSTTASLPTPDELIAFFA